MRMLLILPFVLLTILCWGNYGPLMHEGQHGMGGSSLRPFVCVGLAYFLIAVIVPLLVLKTRGEPGKWTVAGLIWSLIAGVVGAFGAFGVIMAFKFGGKPVYVMPLVFGCAPVVNTFVTMLMSKTLKEARPIFYLGVVLVALGAAGVLYFKPQRAPASHGPTQTVDPVKVSLSIALAALSWGSYGPVLHRGQMKMQGSRLRPFLCVGLAYFAVAVVAPLLWLQAQPEKGAWTPTVTEPGDHMLVVKNRNYDGILWSLAGGTAGAVGALGIILAFNYGGKPIFVMPLVFGGAPVINTFTTIVGDRSWNQVSVPFVVSLLIVIVGAITVLIFAPKPAHAPKPPGNPDDYQTPDGPSEGARTLLGHNP